MAKLILNWGGGEGRAYKQAVEVPSYKGSRVICKIFMLCIFYLKLGGGGRSGGLKLTSLPDKITMAPICQFSTKVPSLVSHWCFFSW